MIVEVREDVVDAGSSGKAESPDAGLQLGTADLGTAAEHVDERNPTFHLIASDGTALSGVDAVVGATGMQATFSLNAEIAIEVSGDAEQGALGKGLVRVAGDGGVYGMKVTVAGEEIYARFTHGRCA